MGMRSLRLESMVTADQVVELSLLDADVGEPEPEEVVVRVEAAPINPSDLGAMFAGADVGQAARRDGGEVTALPLGDGAMRAAAARIGQPLPVGNEGAGTVVAAGSDAQELIGRVVAVAGGAMYSQYRRVPVAACLPLPDGTPAEAAAASFVNPMTALAMLETMRAEGHTAIVHTAAASALGQMLNRLCISEQVALVNIVRSAAQRELLEAAGAAHVCDSSSDTFTDELTAAIRETGATLAFDAIGGGPLASRTLTCMERVLSADAGFQRYGSTVHKQVYIYGSLDAGPTTLNRSYGMAWSVGGWLLMPTLAKLGPERVARMRAQVAEGLTTIFATTFSDRVTLAEALDPDRIAAYGRPSTGTKFLITPEH